MNDLFNDNQPVDLQSTRRVEPVNTAVEAARPARRRRTERFAGLIDETTEEVQEAAEQAAPVEPEVPVDQNASAAQEGPAAQETPAGGTRQMPVIPKSAAEKPEMPEQLNWTRSRVPARQEYPDLPFSQGVPRPAALSGQQRRPDLQTEGTTRNTPAVRRPVKAEGYAPLQQLGTQEQPRVRRPEQEFPSRLDVPRRVRTPETERIAYAEVPEEEEKVKGRGLIAVILALLLLAAAILGLMMVPDDDPGVLGDIKRAVTVPVKELLGIGKEDDKAVPAAANSFTATISQATAPYKVVYHMVTTQDVTAVRVVDQQGNVIPTVTTLSAPNSETTIVWMFEMTLADGYEGLVQAQMQDDGVWVDTGLTQMLSLGGSTVPTVTGGPAATFTPAASTSTAKPTATPTTTPTQQPTQAPVETETAVPVEEPVESTEAPVVSQPGIVVGDEGIIVGDEGIIVMDEGVIATPAPVETPAVTATPTMSVTATPTIVPTATPTAEPTEEPTPEPTVEPTPEPTAAPTATPMVTPKLEAAAAESADPALISVTKIYMNNRKTETYERDKPMNMPASDEYLTRAFGVTTFRGNAFRQNAAVDTVDGAESLSLAWTVEAGSVAGSSRNYYGIGWTNQPVIAKWPSDIRKGMTLEDVRKEQKNLKEVIVAGLDGQIYFLDLQDGTATRDAIDFGYPMRSTPSLHPLSYPMMTVGQYARKLKSGTSDNIGLYYYSLMNQKQLRLIDGLDRKLNRPYYAVGAFDTSALIDRNTNTLIAIGTNGLLYTETLKMEIYGGEEGIVYQFDEPSEVVTMMSHTKGQRDAAAAVESSLAMYGSYAYYADMGGVLRCVDTTTMTTAWAVETGDAVRAAIALDLEQGENGSTLWLYTANLVNNSRTKGQVTIRRFNAMTGEEDWNFAIHCAKGKKKDVTFNSTVIPGAMASPVIGQHGLNDLVYFTLSSVSATGAKTLSAEAAMEGVIIALNKSTGEVVWHNAMEAYCYSSPVAVYDENGKGWIIQACSNGTIYLMDGLTGEVINTLAVNGVIEGSPAVYGDMMVIGTTGKNTSYIYGIKIN